MQSRKVIITLWVKWKKTVKLVITLEPKDVDGAQDIGNNIEYKCIKEKIPLNSLMTEFFLKAAILKN